MEQRSVRIGGRGPLLPTFKDFMVDTDRPNVSPEQLLRERKGRRVMPGDLHNCPFCHKTWPGDVFIAHLRPCLVRNYSTLDPTLKVFRGASLND